MLSAAAIERVAAQISGLAAAGYAAVLVSSGAVAAGFPAMGLVQRPGDVPGLQAAAAVGQGLLMERYHAEFAARDRMVGQILITKEILADREQYLHARDTFERLLGHGVIPIVNENDTVVVDELKLGDNDTLAAIVSHLVGAGMLIILTDTLGLYASDPRLADDPELIDAVRHTDEVLDVLAGGAPGPLGSGGVATKVAAARMAAWSGIPTVVAGAGDPDVVDRAVRGEAVGTWVEPHHASIGARKLWIAFSLPSVGSILTDEGATEAIVAWGKSLLPAGIVHLEGEFGPGDAVEVFGPGDELIAKGLVRIGADELRHGLGKHSSLSGGVVVHRDDLVVLAPRP
jgi:glutamate 5-kinase